MPNLIGQSLGRYHILEQLGEGGMAIVYKAYDTRLERDVAVKVIRTEKLTIETMGKTLKRFEREAKALAKLTHPNIVPITDYGEHDEKPYLVMPYLPGGTLKQKLGKPIPWEESVRLLIPIARALHYAHQQGIIHRDVKPSNILITQSGEPMLTDFGIAKILLDTEETADLTGTGMGVGTPEYMSPEQFQGKGVDARTDVYSLGVVLYEMVTGRKPYQADTPAAVLVKQVTEALPRPTSFAPSLPDAVEKMLLKALAREKENRYESVAAFGDALETLLMGMGKEKKPAIKSVKSDLDTQDTISQEETYSTKLQTATYNETPRKARVTQSTPSLVFPEQKKTVWWPWAIGTLVIGFALYMGFRQSDSGYVPAVTEAPAATEVSIATEPPTSFSSSEHPLIISTENATEVRLLSEWREGLGIMETGVVFSPDGKILASAGNGVGVWLWQISGETLTLYQQWGDDFCTDNMSFSPDGQLLATCVWDKIEIRQVSDGKIIQTLNGHTDAIWGVAFSPNGQLLASESQDKTTRLWRVSDGSLLYTLETNSWGGGIAFSPDGQILAVQGQGAVIQLWNVLDMNLIRTLEMDLRSDIVFSPDGKLLAAGDTSGTKIWRVSDGTFLNTLGNWYTTSVTFSPDGQILASGSDDFKIRLWRLSDGILLNTLNAHTDYITGLAFSPDGRILASTSNDSTVRIWGITP